jgi:hypothetical protein
MVMEQLATVGATVLIVCFGGIILSTALSVISGLISLSGPILEVGAEILLSGPLARLGCLIVAVFLAVCCGLVSFISFSLATCGTPEPAGVCTWFGL